MTSKSHHPPLSTSTSISTQLKKCQHLPRAKQIHCQLVTSGLLSSSPSLTTSLITLYSRLSRPRHSLSAFLSSPHPPSLFTYNALISSLAAPSPSLSLLFFRRLRSRPHPLLPHPDNSTFPPVLTSFSSLGLLSQVRSLHSLLLKLALHSDPFVCSALLRAYLHFSLPDDADKAFDEAPHRDVVLWNSMLTGLARTGDSSRALGYYLRMGREGARPGRYSVTAALSALAARAEAGGGRAVHGFAVKAGLAGAVAVGNALVDLYGKCHEVGDAAGVFEGMEERDLLSWNSMVSAFQHSAEYERTLGCFCRMRRAGVAPDVVTVAAVLPACTQAAASLMHGREIHAYMVTSGMSDAADNDIFIHNALIDMYGKSGALADGRRVFDRMVARDRASWNIIIHSYAVHGHGSDALALFDDMLSAGMTPDGITFIGLLSACSHSGLVERGREILQQMDAVYGVVPAMEHYSCVVDLLGRAGRLKEAREVAEQANEAGVWRTYLASCRVHGDTEEAVDAADKVVELEPMGSGGYVLLANAYGSAGRFEEVEEVRGEMWRRRVRKVVGCSWVEVSGSGVHTFVMGDSDHPEAKGIYGALHALVRQMRGHGTPPAVVVMEA